MKELEPKVAIVKKDEKQQDQKKQLIFSSKHRPGLKLFALDPEEGIVYEVKIEDTKTMVLGSDKKTSSKTAKINPDHPMMWSLNLKNATRKFKKQFAL